jgi:hypothetical protein
MPKSESSLKAFYKEFRKVKRTDGLGEGQILRAEWWLIHHRPS